MANITISLPWKFWQFVAESIEYRINVYEQELAQISDEDRISEIQNDLPLLKMSLADICENLP